MNDIFPAIERRFNSDPECMRRCRKLYQLGDDDRALKPYARWTESGGDNLDSFSDDATQHDGEFVLYAQDASAENIRKMADAIIRAFDDALISQGGFARIDGHRTGTPIYEYDDGIYSATIPYTFYAVQATKVPAVRT